MNIERAHLKAPESHRKYGAFERDKRGTRMSGLVGYQFRDRDEGLNRLCDIKIILTVNYTVNKIQPKFKTSSVARNWPLPRPKSAFKPIFQKSLGVLTNEVFQRTLANGSRGPFLVSLKARKRTRYQNGGSAVESMFKTCAGFRLKISLQFWDCLVADVVYGSCCVGNVRWR